MPKFKITDMLVKLELANDIKHAEALVLSGKVYANGIKVNKAGDMLNDTADITIKNPKGHSWVSRGGMKLDHGLKYFKINVKDFIAVDIGSSTGGFTDVLLNNGASKVYAVDVGYGELAWKLRQDSRVVVHERTNARYINNEIVTEQPDIIVCDASFISLKMVLPATMALAKSGTVLIALIKPQFEVQKHEVGKGGIIKDPLLHQRVCDEISTWFLEYSGWQIMGITQSPILGADGNKEFLLGGRYSE